MIRIHRELEIFSLPLYLNGITRKGKLDMYKKFIQTLSHKKIFVVSVCLVMMPRPAQAMDEFDKIWDSNGWGEKRGSRYTIGRSNWINDQRSGIGYIKKQKKDEDESEEALKKNKETPEEYRQRHENNRKEHEERKLDKNWMDNLRKRAALAGQDIDELYEEPENLKEVVGESPEDTYWREVYRRATKLSELTGYPETTFRINRPKKKKTNDEGSEETRKKTKETPEEYRQRHENNKKEREEREKQKKEYEDYKKSDEYQQMRKERREIAKEKAEENTKEYAKKLGIVYNKYTSYEELQIDIAKKKEQNLRDRAEKLGVIGADSMRVDELWDSIDERKKEIKQKRAYVGIPSSTYDPIVFSRSSYQRERQFDADGHLVSDETGRLVNGPHGSYWAIWGKDDN